MKSMYLAICGVIGFAGMVSGCASSSNEVTAAYISPLTYQNLSCTQLGEEAQRISARVAQVSGAQDDKATNDAIATTAAVIVFWPAAFLVGGNDQVTAELARLKGEFEAVEKVAIQKNCGLQIRRVETKPVDVAHGSAHGSE